MFWPFDSHSNARDWNNCIEEYLIKTANLVAVNLQHIKNSDGGVVLEFFTMALQQFLLCFLMFNAWVSASNCTFLGHRLSEKKA